MELQTEPTENGIQKKEKNMEADNRWYNINCKYVPIKAHYFFLFGGMGGTVPYIQVFAKDFGISPTAVGTIYTIVPLCVCLAKPAFGFITDKLQNIKAILIMLLLLTAFAFFAILYIPPIRDYKVESINLAASCEESGNKIAIIPPNYDSVCAKEIMNQHYNCELTSSFCLINRTLNGILNVTNVLPRDKDEDLVFDFIIHSKYIHKPECDCLENYNSSLVCEPNFYKCDSFTTKTTSEYKMYNFWIFVLLAIIGGTGSATAFCLTDAACYEILSDNPRQYGKQRLWATISWGLATLTSGYFNDMATGGSKYTDYSPGFYLMMAFVAIDIIILCTLRLKKANISTSICKDICTIYSSWRTVVFSLGVYICGALTGLLWTYQFWFLTELGSSQLLLGLVAGVQCLIAEVPFFFFSGWFIKKFGHFYCLTASLAAFSLRIGLYCILENPWYVLPIECLHGITYAILIAAMTLYAIDFAPPGTEATMLGILGGIFEGLGVATGSFLGGFGFDNFGGRWTFFYASMASLCCVPVFLIIYKILPRSEGTMELDWDSTIYSNGVPNYGSQRSNTK